MTEEDWEIVENKRDKVKSLTWSVFALMLCTLAASSIYMWAVDKYGEDIPYWPMMTLQGMTSIVTFFVSALIGVGIAEKKLCGSELSWHIRTNFAIFLVILMVIVQPLISWGSYFNEMICSWPFMAWTKEYDIDQSAALAKMISFAPLSHYVMTIIIMAIIPAICEEFFFRGVVLRGLVNAMRTEAGAIIASAVFFSLMHLELSAFLPRLMLGFLLGFIYVHTQSLLYPIIAHSANNILVLIVMSKSDVPLEQLLSQPTENPGPWLPIASMLLTAWICELIYWRDKITEAILARRKMKSNNSQNNDSTNDDEDPEVTDTNNRN